MIKSMTGFGKAEVAFSGGHVKVELKTFNHKYFEPSFKIAEQVQPFEELIKKYVQKHIRRGKVYLWLYYDQTAVSAAHIMVDERRVQRYYHLLAGLKRKYNLAGEITLDQLLARPDIFICKPIKDSQTALWRVTAQALGQAVQALVKMRQREGKALARDILQRVQLIERSLAKVKQFLPRAVDRYETKIKQKLNNGAEKGGMSDERLQSEVALYAKNCDVSEEMTRLASHLSNIRATLRRKAESGKVLDFIAQEMHREINTLGAKSSDMHISREVISVKGEIEKIREQVQNVE